MLRRQPQPSYYQQRPIEVNPPRSILREPPRRNGPQPIRFGMPTSRSMPDYTDSQRNSEPLDSQEYYDSSQQRLYEPRYNNDPLRDSGSGLEPDLVEQKKMISEQSKMLDEIKSTVNASQAQLKSLSDDLKSSSQNLEASQEKVIQPVVTLLQTLAEDVKKVSDTRSATAQAAKSTKDNKTEEWKTALGSFEKAMTKVLGNFQKQQEKKMKEFAQEIIKQVKEMVDKKESNQLEFFEQSVISCLSNKIAPTPIVVNEQGPEAPAFSPEQTQIVEAVSSPEPINATQPTSTSTDNSAATAAPEKRRRKYKALIRDLPIMGNRDCIEQSQALSQVFDCDDTKGRYNLRRRVQVPVVYDGNYGVECAAAMIKKESQAVVAETQEFAWWDADDTTQEQQVKPAKKRGRKRKADLISPPHVPSATAMPIENLCNTSSSLGPVPLEDCPDEVDGDFNWVRVFHKVQKLV